MTAEVLLREFNTLPPNFQELVFEYVRLLNKTQASLSQSEKTPLRKTPKFGFGKSKIWTSPDFDEPLEIFKEYMPLQLISADKIMDEYFKNSPVKRIW